MPRHGLMFDDVDPMNCSCVPAADPDEPLSPEQSRILTNGKAGVAVAVFFLTLGAELLPWFLVRFQKAVELLAIGACFAAGVILGAGFCHMAPDSEEAWNNYFEYYTSQDPPQSPPGLRDPDRAGYPFGQFIAIVTLLVLMAIDGILVRGGLEGHHPPGGLGHSHAVPQLPRDYQEEGPIAKKSVELNKSKETEVIYVHPYKREGAAVEDPAVKVSIKNGDLSTTESANQQSQRGSQEQIAQAWIFFVALAIHSIFDGLSLGAETHMDGFYALLVAILAHKALDGFALGVPVYFANLPLGQMWFALIFCAAMTPLGIGIGAAATGGVEGIKGQLSKAIILSISTGSFYFISLVELLPSGLQDGKHLKFKFGITAVGFGFMALIAIWV